MIWLVCFLSWCQQFCSSALLQWLNETQLVFWTSLAQLSIIILTKMLPLFNTFPPLKYLSIRPPNDPDFQGQILGPQRRTLHHWLVGGCAAVQSISCTAFLILHSRSGPLSWKYTIGQGLMATLWVSFGPLTVDRVVGFGWADWQKITALHHNQIHFVASKDYTLQCTSSERHLSALFSLVADSQWVHSSATKLQHSPLSGCVAVPLFGQFGNTHHALASLAWSLSTSRWHPDTKWHHIDVPWNKNFTGWLPIIFLDPEVGDTICHQNSGEEWSLFAEGINEDSTSGEWYQRGQVSLQLFLWIMTKNFHMNLWCCRAKSLAHKILLNNLWDFTWNVILSTSYVVLLYSAPFILLKILQALANQEGNSGQVHAYIYAGLGFVFELLRSSACKSGQVQENLQADQ